MFTIADISTSQGFIKPPDDPRRMSFTLLPEKVADKLNEDMPQVGDIILRLIDDEIGRKVGYIKRLHDFEYIINFPGWGQYLWTWSAVRDIIHISKYWKYVRK